MKYAIKVSGTCRYDGEYEGGNTLVQARKEAASFLPEASMGRISIVRFHFGPKDPEDGRVEVVERYYDAQDRR